jgi:hypothetical protein
VGDLTHNLGLGLASGVTLSLLDGLSSEACRPQTDHDVNSTRGFTHHGQTFVYPGTSTGRTVEYTTNTNVREKLILDYNLGQRLVRDLEPGERVVFDFEPDEKVAVHLARPF